MVQKKAFWVTIIVAIICIAFIPHNTVYAKAKKCSMVEYRYMDKQPVTVSYLNQENKENGEALYAQIMDESRTSISLKYNNFTEYYALMKSMYLVQATYFYYEQFSYMEYKGKGTYQGYININTQNAREKLKQNQYIRKQVKKIAKKLKITKKTTEKTAVTKINNYMRKTYSYDYTFTNASAYELLQSKTGICSAYSDLFKHICSYVGIKTDGVIGNDGTHEWNRVQINRKWYYIDVTWNSCVNKNSYFLMTKKVMKRKGEHKQDYIEKKSVVNLGVCLE